MFSIVIPVFNESKNISNLVDEIDISLKKYENYEIIIVNDCSTDETAEVISNKKNKKIKLINNKKNLGQSYSIHTGIKSASYNIIVTLDGDGQNDPSDISSLLNLFLSNKDIELIGGIRALRKDNIVKVLSSKISNYIRSRILNDSCSDTGCSLKVFNREIFLTFPYFDGIHRFLPALFKGFGHKTIFINVNHRKRLYGISKYGTLNRLFKGIKDIARVKKILNKYNNE